MNLEFELRLKDMLSGILPKVEAAARRAFEGIDGSMSKTQHGMEHLGRSVEGVHEKISMLHEKMGMLRESSAMFFGELAAEGAMRTFEFAKEQVKDILKLGMEEGMQERSIKVMAGDKAGERLYEQTKAYISKSMFGPQLFQQDKLLLGYGEDPRDIITDIKRMGDISGGDQIKMESLTEALGKVMMYGHFGMLEMRQLATTGFNPMKEIERKTGKKMDPDDITLKMYRDAMKYATEDGGRFYKQMERVMETAGGKYKELSTNIEMSKARLGEHEKIVQAEIRLFDKLAGILDKVTQPENMDKLAAGIAGLIDTANDAATWMSHNTDKIASWFHELKVGAELFIGWKALRLGTGALAGIGGVAIDGMHLMRGMGKMRLAEEGAEAVGGMGMAARIGAAAMPLAIGATLVGGALLVKLLAEDLQKISNHYHPSAEEERERERVKRGFWGPGIQGDKRGPRHGEKKEGGFSPEEQAQIDKATKGLDGLKGNKAYFDTLELIKKQREAGLDGPQKKGGSTAAASDTSDAIVGGGKRVVNINYNAPLYKVDRQVFQNVKDAINDFEPKIKEAMLRILYSVPGTGN